MQVYELHTNEGVSIRQRKPHREEMVQYIKDKRSQGMSISFSVGQSNR